METLQSEIITRHDMNISHIQDMEITHLLTQVAAGFEGWPSKAVDEFIVRVKAVAADKKRQNTKAARAQENERLRCYGRALDALIAVGTISKEAVQAALDKVVESNVTRKHLGLAEKESAPQKKQRGRPTGSKNKCPKRGGLEAVDMEKDVDGAVQQAETAGDEHQRSEAQKNGEQVGQQESQDTPIDEPQQDTGDAEDQQVVATHDTTTDQEGQGDAQALQLAEQAGCDEQDDENWAAQFPHRPGSPRAQGGTWLGILREEREEPKSLGAKWDKSEGQWYTLATDLTPFGPWLRSFFPEKPTPKQAEDGVQRKRVYLIIPYKEAEQKAKEMGAIYDEDCKRYYLADGDDPQLFVQSGFRLE